MRIASIYTLKNLNLKNLIVLYQTIDIARCAGENLANIQKIYTLVIMRLIVKVGFVKRVIIALKNYSNGQLKMKNKV